MNISRSRFLMMAGFAGAAGLLANVNCGGGGGGGGTGGASATGGKIGTGGASSTGGKTGTGGNSTTGTGGNVTTGTGGGGGSPGTGGGAGSPGTGGHAGNGGAGGTSTDGGAQQFAALSYTFDSSAQGFAIDTFGTGNVATIDGGTAPTLSWDSGVGKPDNGSVKVEATFSDYSQFVISTLNIRPLLDASGKTLHAWVMADAVDGGNFSGYAQLQVNTTTSYHGATGAAVNITPGTWQELTINLATPAAPFDASQIIQVSVKFATFSPPDSGTFGGPVHATFHFDSITDGSGGAAPPPVNATFDANTQGFSVVSSGVDGGTAPTVTFDSAAGDPSAGSIAVTLPFTAYNQSYSVQSPLQPTTDLTGKTFTAWVMMDKADGGAGEFMQGYVQLFAESGSSFTFASGGAKGLTPGVWTQLSVTTAALKTGTASFDPSQVVQFGVQIGVGGQPDGGVFGGEETPTFHIDSIVAQ